MTTVSEILIAAQNLNPQQRAEVAHELLLTLEPAEVDEDAEQLWAAEIRRRLQAIREGTATLRDWDEVLVEIRRSITSGDRA
jgi:hypothetical protein